MAVPEEDEAQVLARRCAEAMWADDRASAGLGMALADIGPGRATLVMTVTEAMVNGHGICHGGFIFTLADSAFAFACNSFGEKAVAQQASILFVRPGRLGERLTAQAELRTVAGRSALYDVRVIGEDRAVVAEFRGQSRLTGHVFFAGD